MSQLHISENYVMSLEWWQKNVVYHVYVPSFKDSNDDGVGDLKGLLSKLDYFSELNVSTLMLSPFYPSPMEDNGYDVSSFVDVDSKYGTMDDFDNLILEMKNRDLNILIDFVANHTSDQHDWFLKSVNREKPYDDFYIWVDANPASEAKNILPPTNWLSVFDSSAWTWNETRKQFYFHQFLPEQPDLNYRNSLKVLVFWLKKGVDGFRVDAASHLFEDELLRDEPQAEVTVGKKEDEYAYLDHIYTKGLKENRILLAEWRNVLEEYAVKSGKSKILFVEATEKVEDIMHYYGSFGIKLADFPLNFQLYKITTATSGIELKNNIELFMKNVPKGKTPNWVLSSHDDPRVVSRVGKTLALSLHMVEMMLPGLPLIYYGDEIGMENGTIEPKDMKDSFALRTVPSNSRDPMRTPMQWNSGNNAGFSECRKPWLPVCENYKTVNVEVEQSDPLSFLNTFKQLIRLRQVPSILVGILEYPLITEAIFSCLRFLAETKCFLLVLNLSFNCHIVDLLKTKCLWLPETAVVEVINSESSLEDAFEDYSGTIFAHEKLGTPTSSSDYVSKVCKKSFPLIKNMKKGVEISLRKIFLKPKEAVILSFIGKLH